MLGHPYADDVQAKPHCLILLMTSTRRGGESGSDGRMCMGKGSAPCGRPDQTLETIDVILSSSHAWKLCFKPEFCLWTEQNVEIFRQYKLVK